MAPVELILSKMPEAKRSGRAWMAPCPAHGDRRASLSIGVGDDGRALVHCHAGCTAEAIVSALGLEMADLMPSNGGKSLRSKKRTPASKAKKLRHNKADQVYSTADDAIAELERRHGPHTAPLPPVRSQGWMSGK